MKIRGTDFVLYHVSNLTRSVAFYRDVLGLPVDIVSEEHNWAEFDCGNVTLALQATRHPMGTGCGARLALAVDDIQSAYDELLAKHATVAQAPQDHGVCHAFDVRDPDGNLILLHCRADGTFGQANVSPTSEFEQPVGSAFD